MIPALSTPVRAGSTATAVPGLAVTGLRRDYGSGPVLGGVDLEVAAGSLTAVLGRSGCGKTTLLRLIAGFDTPDAGTVTLAGTDVAGPGWSLPPERRRIGYVTQEGNLFPHLDVAGNVAFGLPRRERRGAAGAGRVARLLELVGLEARYARRRPDQLSGGEQQRVALARALAPRPDVVLLDEPFSALDVGLREVTRRAVAEALAAAGATTVLVTHDQAEALSLADRVAVLHDGRIGQVDPPAQLYRRPRDRAVAQFVGDVVILPAVRSGSVLECALGRLPAPPDPARDGPVSVLLRPEQIVLGASGVPADVLGSDFYGHDALVRLELGDATVVTARCPGHELPSIGTTVRLTVRGVVSVLAAG